MEIGSLREVLNIRKKKGKFNDVESQLLRLKVMLIFTIKGRKSTSEGVCND